jgi:hypothetical protein
MFEKKREKSLGGLYAFRTSQYRFHEQEIGKESAGQCHGANKSRYHFHPSIHPFLIILLLNSVSGAPLRCHFSSHLNRHSVRSGLLAISYEDHAVVLCISSDLRRVGSVENTFAEQSPCIPLIDVVQSIWDSGLYEWGSIT